MLPNNLVAFVVTLFLAITWLRLNDFLAHRGLISTRLSRKIIHVGTGPIYVLCWLLFQDEPTARFLAALIPFGITLQFALVGMGILHDQAAVKAMSRSGERREILRGPLFYGIAFILLTVIYWKNSPIGISALMILCGGDGIADVVGSRFGHTRIPWSKEKSWIGSLTVLVGGFLFSSAILEIYSLANLFSIPATNLIPGLFLIAFVAAAVESLPYKDIDNLTVPLAASFVGHIVFQGTMVHIDGYHLSLDDVLAVARMNEPVELAKSAIQAINQSASWVLSMENSSKPVYGVNTGFGIFADRIISLQDSYHLSRNLILSHAVGTGSMLPTDDTRAAMLVRANTLAKGFSGVRIDIIESLLHMINGGVTPIIPSQGSLGSSGDLAQLAHMALVFTTDHNDREEESGKALFKEEYMSGLRAMQSAGLQRLILGPKEGLAIINGAAFTAAIAALVIADSISLLQIADLATAMSLEALLGAADAFHPRLQTVRGQSGQIRSAASIRRMIQASTLIGAAGRIQDAYSLRCAPQVHGAAYDTVQFAREIVERELNAATDNPLIFGPELAISGGNFHGEPVGMVMDYLGIALTEIAAISERRTFRLIDPNLNAGLPPMLVDHPEAAGLNSGVMMPQYTAASLVLENRVLATPDSIQSLPTSGGQEDHNANAMTASRHSRMIVDNTAQVLAIELFTAARALDLRLRDHPELKMGAGVSAAHRLIREVTPYEPGDSLWGPQIDLIRKALIGGELINKVINHL